jgi:aminoglycoside 3-N-acetyltransferase
MERYDYSKEDIVRALTKVGIKKNDSIFVHSNIGFFGQLKEATTKESYYYIFKEAIFEVIGEGGTLVVPTFSYSFCKKEIFDKEKTKSVCGFFSEMVRKDPQSLRSDDANFSVAAVGKNAEYFTKNAPPHSFGKNSFWERFLKCNGKFCNFNFDAGSTFVHYVEKLLNVPYRYDKKFPGKSIINGKAEERVFYHFVYDLTKPNNGPNFEKFDKRAKELGIAKTANLGKGQIVSITARDVVELIKREIQKDPAFLIKGSRIEF